MPIGDPPVRRRRPLDEDYQGPAWWHLSRLAEVPRSRGMRRIAALGSLVFAISVVTGIMNVTEDWNGVPVRFGGLELPITFYPPFVLGLLAAVWIGPTWGILPAYAANLAGALVSGLAPLEAVLFALSGALELLIFWGSMVTLNINPELRRRRDLVRFAFVSLIAPMTASLAVLIWNAGHGLDLAQGYRVWRGWIVGDILQALLIVAPLLRFAGPAARSWIDRQFAHPPRYEVTYTRAALLAAVTFALIAALVFVGIYMMQESLDIDPATKTSKGEFLLPRLQQFQIFLGVLVAALTVATGVFSNVLARMGERQRRLSRRESLTGCFNRRAFYELFPRESERARRLGQGLALVFLDIDHFKSINDRFGRDRRPRAPAARVAPALHHPRDGPPLPVGRRGVRDPSRAHGADRGAGSGRAHPRGRCGPRLPGERRPHVRAGHRQRGRRRHLHVAGGSRHAHRAGRRGMLPREGRRSGPCRGGIGGGRHGRVRSGREGKWRLSRVRQNLGGTGRMRQAGGLTELFACFFLTKVKTAARDRTLS